MKSSFFIVCLFYTATMLYAQDKFKFGDCPLELLTMSVYEKDPEAAALVVYENTEVYYQLNATTADFEIITEYEVRIKLFTQEGISSAEISIPFYKGQNRTLSEEVRNLTAWTYNAEGNQILKNKLSKDYIFTEDVTENLKRIKFAMPAVKAGSVIEYKYKFISPFYYYPKDILFQRTIPVQYSSFRIKIPEYFKFNREIKGYEPIEVKINPVNMNFMYKGNTLTCSGDEIVAKTTDLPALKDENFVWNYNDFKARIDFEIQSVQIPGVYYKDFSQTWTKVIEELNKYEFFGRQFNNKNIFKEDLPSVLAGKTSDTDSIRAVLNLVRSKVKWNNQNTLRIENQSKALKEGSGSSGEINSLLLNALRNAGFAAYPVAMSLRSKGRIPITYPSINNLNYFIVCVNSGEKTYYLDGTRSYTDINIIPTDCLVDKALIIFPNNFDWIDLNTIGNNLSRVNLILGFNENGILQGQKIETYSGEVAYSFKQSYEKYKDEQEYTESLETKNDVSISNYKMEERTTPNFNYYEKFDFLKTNVRLEGDVISFNPLLFLAMKENAFKTETRKLPIEFPYPMEQRINVAITLPEGYVIDELPTSERFLYDEELIDFSYIIQQSANIIQLVYKVKIATNLFPATGYELIRDFWVKMYNKENQLITIKKSNP